ncbi:MAG: oxygenase MpaB family protein [Acidobacteriota bacterium]
MAVDPHQPVSRDESEALIAAIEGRTAEANDGIFGPGSLTWRINRESALFLGAGRAALLQLAHPWVAVALEQHSHVMSRPIERFHNTFRIVFTMIFGTLEQAKRAARHLYELHTHIEGEMPEAVAQWERGSHYQANEIAALRWVYATLVESAVMAYEFVFPPLSVGDLEAYYAESRVMAALFGLPGDALPANWNSFLGYCRSMEASSELGVSDKARAMGHGLLRGAGSWIKPPRWYRALTAEWLPARFRAEFGLANAPADEAALARARRWFPRVYGTLPRALRFVGPYQEARARLAGRRPGLVARAGNRFWIGEWVMPFGEI